MWCGTLALEQVFLWGMAIGESLPTIGDDERSRSAIRAPPSWPAALRPVDEVVTATGAAVTKAMRKKAVMRRAREVVVKRMLGGWSRAWLAVVDAEVGI